MNWIRRKWRTLHLNVRIYLHSEAMRGEVGLTQRWKRLSRQRDRLIQQRNHLRTQRDLERLERWRRLK